MLAVSPGLTGVSLVDRTYLLRCTSPVETEGGLAVDDFRVVPHPRPCDFVMRRQLRLKQQLSQHRNTIW